MLKGSGQRSPILLISLVLLAPAAVVGATNAEVFDMSCNVVPGPSDPLRPEASSGSSVRNYHPGPFERLFNATKLTLQVKDTPDFLVTEREVMTGDVTRTVPEFFPNPDQRLSKYSVEFSLANAVFKSADLKTLYAGVAASPSSFNLALDPVQSDRWEYFSRTRPRDQFARLLSGFKLTVAVSERPTPDPTAVLSPRLEELLRRTDEHEETFALEFDPKYLFPTSADYSAAAAALGSYAKTFRPGALGISDPSTAGPRGAARFLAAALPTFKVESVDQFDFLEFGGRFLRSSLLEESIEVFTLTWDLKRFLKLRADRLTDLGTQAALAKLMKAGPQVVKPTTIQIENGSPVYWRLARKGGVGTVTWHLLESCDKQADDITNGVVTAGLTLESSGVIGGYPSNLNLAGCSFKVAARDAIGQNTRLACSIQPKPVEMSVVLSDLALPRPGCRLLLLHAFNECRNGTWHVVTKGTYECGGTQVIKEVHVVRTNQPCKAGDAPSSVQTFVSFGIPSRCTSPVKLFTFHQRACPQNATWNWIAYDLMQCADGRLYLLRNHSADWVTSIPCTQPAPAVPD